MILGATTTASAVLLLAAPTSRPIHPQGLVVLPDGEQVPNLMNEPWVWTQVPRGATAVAAPHTIHGIKINHEILPQHPPSSTAPLDSSSYSYVPNLMNELWVWTQVPRGGTAVAPPTTIPGIKINHEILPRHPPSAAAPLDSSSYAYVPNLMEDPWARAQLPRGGTAIAVPTATPGIKINHEILPQHPPAEAPLGSSSYAYGAQKARSMTE